MTTVVTGLFDTAEDASAAVRTLEARGVDPARISVLAAEGFDREAFTIDSHSKLPEGAAIGAGTGGAIGAIVTGFTAVGAIATGGVGLIAAGPIVAALAGAGAGAAGGGVLGMLIGWAFPEHEVKHYEEAIEKGAVLVAVECDEHDDKDLARKALKEADAKRISHI